MTSKQISSQKVIAILKKDWFDKHGIDPLSKVIFSKIHQKEKPFDKLKSGGEILLQTGAKLFMDNGYYYIGGYAEDNHDINHYFKQK